METKTIVFDEAIWGEIYSYEMPFQDIYFVCGKKNEGYVLPKEYRGKVVASNTLSFGTEVGDTLCFASGGTRNIIEYELLRYRLFRSEVESERRLLCEQMEDIQQFGRIDLCNYFGAYPPPNEMPVGIVEDFIAIRNGMYFVKASGQWLFAICDPIAHSELTILAQLFATKKKDYAFYDLTTAAIPIYELAGTYNEIQALIASESALHALLCNNFPIYVMEHNEHLAFGAAPLCEDATYTDNAAETYLAFPYKNAKVAS